MTLAQPVLQMVSSDFVGRKKDSATLRTEGDGSFSRFLCCSSVENLARGGGAEEGAPCGLGLAVSGGGWWDDGFDGLGADVEVEA